MQIASGSGSVGADTDQHFAALKETAVMSSDEKASWGDKQENMLRDAIGPDAEMRIKAASETLTKARGKETDLVKIVRSNGAPLALNLMFQAEAMEKKMGFG
jgi:hypothetical protein